MSSGPAEWCPRPTFSLHGEDVIALAILERSGRLPAEGVYVDVGAFHPTFASNTAVLAQRGWRGICIEPNPVMAERLRAARPGDLVLEVAVGSSRREGHLNFFYEWASSNTLDDDFAKFISDTQGVEISQQIRVDVIPLAQILAEHVPTEATIDFMSIDVEGMDLEALRSSDWQQFRPSLVAVEDLDLDLADTRASPVFRFMTDVHYRLVAHAVYTSFYLRWDDDPQWLDVQLQAHRATKGRARAAGPLTRSAIAARLSGLVRALRERR
jgi:FkbM family methyltransferase